MMHNADSDYQPRFWLRDEPPSYSRVWLFKTNRVRGVGPYLSRQPRPSGVTLRLIESGRWRVDFAGTTAEIAPGDLFLALPAYPVEFAQLAPEPWSWLELQFNGEAAVGFVREFGLAPAQPALTPHRPAAARRLFRRLHDLLGRPERDANLVMSLLLRLATVCAGPASRADAATAAPSRELVRRAVTLVETDPAGDYNVKSLALALGVDRTTLGRAFKAETGHGPLHFLEHYRHMKVDELLRNTSLPVHAVAAAAGFRDPKYFISWFRRLHGQSPGAWRK